MQDVVFLTRPGCPQSPLMAERLREALHASGIVVEPLVVDASRLAPTDPRIGYGTPTVLVDGRDLFDAVPTTSTAPT